MKYLNGAEAETALRFINEAAKVAPQSCCLRAQCGAVIVKDGEIIGIGFNSPPLNQKIDVCVKDTLSQDFKSDKTCCIHAEDRAIRDALRRNPGKLAGSRLYFIRLDEHGNKAKAGKPYCTMCSKMALDVGVAEFVLWHEEGITVYETGEYNRLSFQYQE